MIGAIGTELAGRPSTAFPSAAPSHACANPIQHVPNPAAQAASIRFSAASEQFSTAQGLSITLEIKTSTGA